ncbi:MAG: M61 family peptidase, partial [Sphingobacteriales bacterium]
MKQVFVLNIRFLLLLLVAAGLNFKAVAAPEFTYTLSMPEPHTHYFEVELQIKDLKQPHIDLKLPVWAPGSYLVREFAKNIEGFEATTGKGQKLQHVKTDKSTWRITTSNADPITVKYRVYAFELSVRTSYIDASHGYLNGTSVFMYADGHQNRPYRVIVRPYQGWNQVSTGLPRTSKDKDKEKWVFEAENYDVLVDSPFEIGNHKVLKFESAGIPHYVAMYGEGSYEEEKLLRDMKKITDECTKVFGENPVKEYLFIVHNLPGGGGGLEHLNSTTLQVNRWQYSSEGGYNGFLALVAHEYFHLWNIKRIRPEALGPFNYAGENYTTALWFAEGITSYYDDYLTHRAGFYSPDRYLGIVSSSITSVENTPGNMVQSLSESSWDAWIKFYRRSENSSNAEVSYYSKGAVIGMVMDVDIRNVTQNKKSLDDVMRLLWDNYKKTGRGFTDAELQKAFETVAGKSYDDFFRNHIFGTKTIDYNQYFAYAGLKLVNSNASNNEPQLGVSAAVKDGKLTVTGVVRGTAAYT